MKHPAHQARGARASARREHAQEVVGVVTSAKMAKTIVVKVTRPPAPLYQRVIRSPRSFTRMMKRARPSVGDTVRIVDTRPLSKLKRWRLRKLLRAFDRA